MIGSDPQKGASAILFIMLFALALGAYLFMSSESLIFSQRSMRAGSDGQKIAALAMARLKDGLAGKTDCAATFGQFRNFQGNAPTKLLTLSASVPCLVDASDAEKLESFEIRIQQTLNDADLLLKHVKASLKLKTKPIQGVPGRSLSLTRGFRVTVASMDYFNTVFLGTRFPLVSSSNPKVSFHHSVFYAGTAAPAINEITPFDNNLRVHFRQPFLVRSRALRLIGEELDGLALRTVFGRGIETGVLNQATLDAYLPKFDRNWNYGIDYSPLALGVGYPLPHGIDRESAIDCKDELRYKPAAAAVQQVPAPSAALGFTRAAQTCEESPDGHPFVYMQPQADLTITLDAADSIFCGAVVARTLNVVVKGSGRSALFGLFAVENMVVSGSDQAELLVIHPLDGGTTEFDFPAGISAARIADQFESLAASMMRNFFLPMAANSVLRPWSPLEFMDPCVSGTGVARRKLRSSPYQPLPKLPGFNDLRSGAANPLYIVDSTL